MRFTEGEFDVSANRANVRAGDVRVQVYNAGKIDHELVAFRTDLDEAALPMTADGSQVDEAGPGPSGTHVVVNAQASVVSHLI